MALPSAALTSTRALSGATGERGEEQEKENELSWKCPEGKNIGCLFILRGPQHPCATAGRKMREKRTGARALIFRHWFSATPAASTRRNRCSRWARRRRRCAKQVRLVHRLCCCNGREEGGPVVLRLGRSCSRWAVRAHCFSTRRPVEVDVCVDTEDAERWNFSVRSRLAYSARRPDETRTNLQARLYKLEWKKGEERAVPTLQAGSRAPRPAWCATSRTR